MIGERDEDPEADVTLAAYRRKRNFGKTAEPRGGARRPRSGAGAQFVVQQHHATRPHFDLRLQMNGVLKSWAVPKGFSLDPAEKRLAVHVEDHPLEYGTFEGVIPAGEYGAGEVIVWDRGRWAPVDGVEPEEALERGSLKFTLEGERLHGRWHLVRMHGGGESHDNWLLIKDRDRFARRGKTFDPGVDTSPSVDSGKTIEQIARPRGTSRRSAPKKAGRARPGRGSRKASAAVAPRGARPAPFPRSMTPQLATLARAVPGSDDWSHEVKFDGYRILAFVRGGKVRLVSRNHHDWTSKFAPVAEAIEAMPFPDSVLDGEVVALDDRGVSHFQSLQQSFKGGGGKDAAKLVYFVFDLPYCNGQDLMDVPLRERQRILAQLIAEAAPGSERIRISEHIDGSGDAVFENACRLGLEGVISKRVDSPYSPGRSGTWVKVKCEKRQEFVIGGFTDPRRSRSGFGALLVGYRRGGELVYAGKVGTGFDDATLKSLSKKLRAIERESPAFARVPRMRGAHWVRPRLVAEVRFTEWTSDGRLRHPAFLGLREDKQAAEVTLETPRADAAGTRAHESSPRPDPEPGAAPEWEGVRITHPDRVVYPEAGLTKLEVAGYYEQVAALILSLAGHRPLSLVRCPGGRSGTCFYQKHMEIGAAAGLRGVRIRESRGVRQYAVLTGAAGLAYLVQMNALELHAWGSHDDNVERPDRLVFDLDPGEGVTWARVVEAAQRVRGLLEDLGLASFAMLTGGKGIHVVLPIERRTEWDDAKAFSRAVAGRIVAEEPEGYIATMSKAARRGKVFIDYLRNQRGATSIVPYSTRARPGATVAMPVAWEGLAGLAADAFGVRNAPAHIGSRRGDPWRELPKTRQSLRASMTRSLSRGAKPGA